MSEYGIAYDTKTIASEELFQQLERDSLGNQFLGNQFIESDRGESDRGEAADANTLWHGLTFKLEDINLVIPCSGESEVALCGEISPLPLAKSRIKGMTHVRGEIYTIVDFPAFLGAKDWSVVAGCNLICLPDPYLKSALLIDGRVRLQSFNMNLPVVGVETLDYGRMPYLGCYLSSVLIDKAQNWGVIDIYALSNSESFFRIGMTATIPDSHLYE